MKQVNASIITIGDELLIGQTIDTNSAFIAQELNKIGVWVKRRVAVGDVWDDIWQALDDEGKISDIIIITGGLGPTADDITKPLLCKYFGGRLVVNEDVLKHVKYLFEQVYRRPGPMLERNLKQAEVPDVCIVLQNARGTAPGMWFKKEVPNSTQGEAYPNSSQREASPNPSQREASPNPSEGGASDPDYLNSHYSYLTADPTMYGLLKKFVAEHRSNPTEAEKILWKIIKGRKLSGYKFRRQHIINTYIADFVCLPKKLIIEIDGLIHELPENKVTDADRTIDLNRLGFEVIRFTNDQVLYDADNVLNKILLQLKKENSKVSESKAPVIASNAKQLEGFGEAVSSKGFGEAVSSEAFGEAVFISLPGVPHEMKGLIIDEVIPRLLKEFEMPVILHRTAFTSGQGESMIAEHIKDFETSLPSHIKLAYLPGYGMVKLRLTAKGDNKELLEKELTDQFEQLKALVKEWLVTDTDEGLEVVVGQLLKARCKTMATAESCTGGYIAHLITSVAGSSAYYKGSVVSYANEVKENILGVEHATLESVGAVSKETVKQMVKGAIDKLNVDYAVATSGIMGPDGGSDEKPVGTVWIGAGNKEKIIAKEFHFRFDRERNIRQTAHTALDFLRKFILADS